MFPTSETELPTLTSSLGLFSMIGLTTVCMVNRIQNLPTLYRPHVHLYGIVIGAFAGYAIHHAAEYAQREVRKAQIWRRRELERSKTLIEQTIQEHGENLRIKV